MEEVFITFKEWCFEFSPILSAEGNPADFKGKEKIINNSEEESTLWSLKNNEIINQNLLNADKYFITQEHYNDSIKIIVQYNY